MRGRLPTISTTSTTIETFTTTTIQNENNDEKISSESSTSVESITSSKIMSSITPEILSTTTSQVDEHECDSPVQFGVLLQDPKDCGKFYICTLGIYGQGIKHEFTCPGILFFNEELRVCDWPFNVICKNEA